MSVARGLKNVSLSQSICGRFIIASLATMLWCRPSVAQTVTFNKNVAPILFRSCVSCHRPGEGTPFSLLTYDEARKQASLIVAVTQSGYMPPWLPERGYGEFAGERRLSPGDVKTISDWVAQGRAEGNPSDLPAAPRFDSDWQLGTPDLIVRLARPYKVPAGGKDLFRNFILPVNIPTTQYVRAFELRPGNKQLVHHANMFIDHRRTLRNREGEDGQIGFSGMEPTREARSDSFDPDTQFLFWKPGTVTEPSPEGMNWRLDPDSDLILNMHLQPSGKEELLQPTLGLYFSTQPPRFNPMLIQLEHDGAIDIPAGREAFEVSDHFTLPVDLKVLAIYPHAHYLGKTIEAWANLPDGGLRPLIRIQSWDQNWQAVYTYRQPMVLPKGSVVHMRISYDNSAANPRNPHSPPVEVKAGPRSEDEMGHVWLQVLPEAPANQDGRIALQRALMNRRLEKYPGDFTALCNLGELSALESDYREADRQFAEAARAQPDNATARSGWGAALLGEGKLDAAIPQLEEALRLDPLRGNARWNLAHALVLKKDFTAAASQLETLVAQQPRNADAEAGLGGIYFLQDREQAALTHLRRAAELKPNDPDILINLGALLARRGEMEEAIRDFTAVLNQRPGDQVAQKYLTEAKARLATRN